LKLSYIDLAVNKIALFPIFASLIFEMPERDSFRETEIKTSLEGKITNSQIVVFLMNFSLQWEESFVKFGRS